MPALLPISNERRRPAELRRHMLELEMTRFPDRGIPVPVDHAVTRTAAPGLLTQLPNLGAILSTAASVDRAPRDLELPKVIPIVRMNDPHPAAMMSKCAAMAMLRHRQGVHEPRRTQQRAGGAVRLRAAQ